MHDSRLYENENKHEVAIHKNKHARGRPKGKGYMIATHAYTGSEPYAVACLTSCNRKIAHDVTHFAPKKVADRNL